MDENYLGNVRDQYEQLPYPPRDPESERGRLVETIADRLATINHYCLKGECDFDGARVLVAGGGTGDATIHLAEQLQQRNGEVVYLDISRASMSVAQKRAEIRGLTNITWTHGSLLSLSAETIGQFDYVNCTGVLHHLADPSEGLRRLRSVLKPTGGLGLMVYGKYGRTGIYQMQELMRLVNRNETLISDKIANTRRVLDQLPRTNWFRHNENAFIDHKHLGDAGLVDLLLHEQDVAYTIGELYDLLKSADLHFIEFDEVKMRMAYRPHLYIKDPALQKTIAALDTITQQSIAELMNGTFSMHELYASPRPDAQAQLGSLNHVPFFFPEQRYAAYGQQLAKQMEQNPGEDIQAPHGSGYNFTLRSEQLLATILFNIDGQRSWRAIFDATRAQTGVSRSDEELIEYFRPAFEQFRKFDWMLLRGENVPAFPDATTLQNEFQRRMEATGA